MKMTGSNLAALTEDVREAVARFLDLATGDPARWTRGQSGKWSVGQHADHVAIALGLTADALEESERRLRNGVLARRPLRDPLQALFVSIAVGAGKFPRGARTPRHTEPTSHPDRDEVMSRIARDLGRHVALGERLSVPELDRLWIRNPFLESWHYTYPEVLRMQAVHFRHHARSVEEAIGS